MIKKEILLLIPFFLIDIVPRREGHEKGLSIFSSPSGGCLYRMTPLRRFTKRFFMPLCW